MANNAVTLLFVWMNLRANMADASIIPSLLRETFAVCYLQTSGQMYALQTHLGLHNRNLIKRIQQTAGLGERWPAARRWKRRRVSE